MVAYSIFFIISLIATIAVPIFYDTVPAAWNPTIPPVWDFIKIIGCFAVAVLFGLWPDVDIKSKSQKIFYTVLFTLNVVLIVFLQKVLGIGTVRPVRDAPDYEQTPRMDARQNYNDLAAECIPFNPNLYRIPRMEIGWVISRQTSMPYEIGNTCPMRY